MLQTRFLQRSIALFALTSPGFHFFITVIPASKLKTISGVGEA